MAHNKSGERPLVVPLLFRAHFLPKRAAQILSEVGTKLVQNVLSLKVTLGGVDLFLACFEAYFGHFDGLYFPEHLKIEPFSDQKMMKCGPKMHFSNYALNQLE